MTLLPFDPLYQNMGKKKNSKRRRLALKQKFLCLQANDQSLPDIFLFYFVVRKNI